MNYKTYAEAKITNPDSEIVTTTKLHSNGPEFEFLPVKFIEGYYRSQCDLRTPNVEDGIWVICNPADYCSSLKEFLESGFEFSVGDIWLNEDDILVSVDLVNARINKYQKNDENRFILSAAALNGGCKIPAKAEQWSVYNNTMALCDLTDEQVGKLVKHSGCVEHMNPNSGEWGATITPMWNRAGIYRVKSKSERELFIDKSLELLK